MNRRGFLLGLGALVAAPAIIRVAPLMPISTRWTPAYVPIDWLAEKYGMLPYPLPSQAFRELLQHGWSRPMADNWVDLNDHDPNYVRQQLALQRDDWFRGYT